MNPKNVRLLLSLSLAACGVLAPCASRAQSEQLLRFNGGSADAGRAVTTDSVGAIYTGGSVRNPAEVSDFAVVKHTAQGVLQWVRHYRGSPDEKLGSVFALTSDGAGNIYAAGHIGRELGQLQFNFDWLVVSFDPNGVQRWAHVFNGAGNGFDQARLIEVDPSGALFVSGVTAGGQGTGSDANWLTMKYSADGSVQWQRLVAGASGDTDQPVAMAADLEGNLVVFGSTINSGPSGPKDATTVKYGAAGDVLWDQTFTDSAQGDEMPGGVAADAAGNIYVTGITMESVEPPFVPFTLKYDRDGQLLLTLKGDGAGGSSVAVGPDGNFVVAGQSFHSGNSGVTAVSKFDPSGLRLWSTPVSSPGKLLVDSEGVVFLGGARGSTTGHDFFATRLTSSGQIVWDQIVTDGDFAWDVHLSGADFFVTGDAGSDMLTVRFPKNLQPTPPPTVPAAPSGLTATPGNRRVTLRWTDNANNETGFRIERSVNGGGFVQVAQLSANATSFTNTGLTRRQTYTYRVRAFNSSGNSGYSNTASATIP